MKNRFIIPFITFMLLFVSCNNDDDGNLVNINGTVNNQVNSFIYNSLQAFYLYKDEQPLLANDRFNNQNEINTYTNQQGNPINFFELLTPQKDRFSFIVSDFVRLENFFSGVRLSTGMDFIEMDLENENSKYIVATQIAKGSPADLAGIKRGMVFNKIDNEKITVNNRGKLFGSEPKNYSLGLAEVVDQKITDTDQTFNLEKIEFTENPIAVSKVLEVDNTKIGYLLYNSFIRNSEEELNTEFGKFKSAGITDLVVDLRYNGGGSVATAIALASLITGQFTDQVILKEQWNSDLQKRFEESNPERLVQRFVNKTPANSALNSLNLKKVYFLTTKNETASSSELVPNSLSAYIDVVIVGDETGTVGKSQASTTFYDSPNLFNKENINESHKYALQPLIFKSVNNNNVQVPNSGLTPTIIAKENLFNLGTLGDVDEPLLKKALDDITGKATPAAKQLIPQALGKYVGSSRMYDPNYQRMYASE
ncbi:S41 family peptidase [Aquimarina agarilytica]|uniref:S41 family peptidase n=1 Tax=Aquimarina agarilytica TaxID=1087449 RepID=UPI0002890D56|nr:S41 family peptidase [Aquimarina agarilytica]